MGFLWKLRQCGKHVGAEQGRKRVSQVLGTAWAEVQRAKGESLEDGRATAGVRGRWLGTEADPRPSKELRFWCG